jgi:hypothetical protein
MATAPLNDAEKLNLVSVLHNALSVLDSATGEITLNSDEILFIKTMMKENPQSFEKINGQINDILGNRAVHLSDIPQLLYIISVVYVDDFKHGKINILACIQFTLDTILDTGLLPFNGVETAVIRCVVDSSIGLLKTNLPYIEAETEKAGVWCWKGCLSCF